MLKKIIQKIKQNHFLMIICCLIPVVLIVGLLSLFKGSGNYLFWVMILLCPLLHILMMRGHNKHDGHNGKEKKEGPEHNVS